MRADILMALLNIANNHLVIIVYYVVLYRGDDIFLTSCILMMEVL